MASRSAHRLKRRLGVTTSRRRSTTSLRGLHDRAAQGYRSIGAAAPGVRVIIVIGPAAAIGSGAVGGGGTDSQGGRAVGIRAIPVAAISPSVAVPPVSAS